MTYIIQGVLLGLWLSILPGPIFIALSQTSLEKGTLAGLLVGLGIWISDIIIIVLSFIFINSISEMIESESFKFYLGISGGVMLFVFGIITMFSKLDMNKQKAKHSYRNLFGSWLKGFLVNTINPFTFIFWLGLISTYSIGRGVAESDTILLLTSIMVSIVVFNSLLVLASKAIRDVLNQKYISWFSKISGVGLMIFGVFLIIRCL